MADELVPVLSGTLRKRFRDMGDGTIAETISLPIMDAAAWDGSEIDLSDFGSATIWCEAAPSAAYTIEARASASAAWVAQTTLANTATSIGTTSTITTAGRYSLAGLCRLRLTGGTGGTFRISAAQ